MRRIILFTADLETMARFYESVIGLNLVGSEEGWREYAAGGCNIALHRGTGTLGRRAPKVVFYAEDVAAARADLVERGAKKLGRVIATESFEMCDGKDPDGNSFQISSRK